MRQNIVQIFASGSTPLTEALQYERKFLSSVKKQDKICFVVTDGAPNRVDSATDEFKRLSKNALAYGVAIGDDIPRLQSVFGENSFIDARDIKKLPYYICNIIKKNMLK